VGRQTPRGEQVGRSWPAVVLVMAGGVTLFAAAALLGWNRETPVQPVSAAPTQCERVVRVLTASSFAPVLARLGAEMGQGENCVRVATVESDGRAAAARLASEDPDVWIPDDASWAATVPSDLLAPQGVQGSGTVLATSPIFMVAGEEAAARLRQAGGSWKGLADLVENDPAVRLVVADPSTSGDGMVAAGSLAEAVWLDEGMDASALALAKIVPKTRTVGDDAALPDGTGEVGLVPEHAWLAAARQAGDAGEHVLSGRDHTALQRFPLLVASRAASDPERAKGVEALRSALAGPGMAQALDASGLRGPDGRTPPTRAARQVPDLTGEPLPVLGPHHVDHVFASWYRQDRRMTVTMVVDVSWSTSEPAPGSREPLIDLIRKGGRTVGEMLPDGSRLGLWEFGSHLEGNRDFRVVVPTAELTPGKRRSLSAAIASVKPQHTGTGLHDTILAAYSAARDNYTAGTSNQVMVFTDGINEDDPDSISRKDLTQRLQRAKDPRRPVQLSVVGFGKPAELQALGTALAPVGGYVEPLQTARQVEAMFIHLATGGLHAQSD
jgi:hypothetical protein